MWKVCLFFLLPMYAFAYIVAAVVFATLLYAHLLRFRKSLQLTFTVVVVVCIELLKKCKSPSICSDFLE